MTEDLAVFVRDLLRVPPKRGDGLNIWFYRTARYLHAFRTHDEIIALSFVQETARGSRESRALAKQLCAAGATVDGYRFSGFRQARRENGGGPE